MLSIAKNYFTWHFIKWRFLLFLLLLRKVPSTESAGEGWGRNLRNIRRIGTQQDTVNPVNQWGYNSSEVSPAPEFREISRIREFSENSTEFWWYFQNWSKTPQKASECFRNVEKAPKNSTEFLHICQKHPKKLLKSSRIFKKYHRTFPFFSKVPKKAPEKLPNSGEISIW